MDETSLSTNKPKPGGMGMRLGLLVGTNIAIIALFTTVASIAGVDPQGVVGLTLFSALFGFGGAFISLAMSKSIAKRSTGARVIETPTNETEKWLVDTVARLADDAGIGMPEVAVFEGAPNAFATGAKRNDALVAVSTGLVASMDKREVEAVLAHEVAHVANGDMITLTLIQGVVNTFVILISRVIATIIASRVRRGGRAIYFGVVIVMQIVLGFFATMIVMWFSRRREFRADADAGRLTSNEDMISALDALRRDPNEAKLPDSMAALGVRTSSSSQLRKLFSSHPPIEARIEALQRG